MSSINKQSDINKIAWSYKAYEFWINNVGLPNNVASDMKKQPETYLRRHIDFLGDVKGKKIANLLGSCGKKAVPLALMGAEVTIIDISEENRKYAMEVAEAAGANITYIVEDFMSLSIDDIKGTFDIVYLEGGILHYFEDMQALANKIYELLKIGGRLILNDFHPIRKIFKSQEILNIPEDGLELAGDYFDNSLKPAPVAYEKFFEGDRQKEFPKCLLRYWTMGEIITAIATAGFVIDKLSEGPRFDEHKNIPGEFTLGASKLVVQR